jgi:hypothetical protein
MPVGDLTQGYIFVPAEKNIDQTKMNAIVGQGYINPAFISGQTAASSTGTGDYFVFLQSGGTLAKILTQDLGNSLAQTSGFQQQIWSTRLRSFNSISNPTFEVDQRTAGSGTTIGTGGFALDRWVAGRAAGTTMGGSVIQIGPTTIGNTVIPGTNFQISSRILRFTLTTAQASLAAGDYAYIYQTVEGAAARELIADVSSVSIMCRSSVAPISFGLGLRDSPATKSLVKLCTIPTANTWTLITLPNIPVFPAGNFTMVSGSIGYTLSITLACGTTLTTPANDTWQSGNYIGAVGQSNFGAQVVNSTMDFACVQHEPGSQCTTLIDKPFTQNLDECLRYYTKYTNYTAKFPDGVMQFTAGAVMGGSTSAYSNITFPKPMAKQPTVTVTNNTTTTGVVYIPGIIASVGVTSISAYERGVTALTLASAQGTSGQTPILACGWQADTGW